MTRSRESLLKFAKDCPYGCQRTSSSVAYASAYTIACKSCGANTVTSSKIAPRSSSSLMYSKAAVLLWNARSPAQRQAAMEIVTSEERLNNLAFGDLPTKETGQWRPCLRAHGMFVPEVEYKVQQHKDGWAAADDDGQLHIVPVAVFGQYETA